jgi:hypothetical protein
MGLSGISILFDRGMVDPPVHAAGLDLWILE